MRLKYRRRVIGIEKAWGRLAKWSNFCHSNEENDTGRLRMHFLMGAQQAPTDRQPPGELLRVQQRLP
jgi:hypothetical protein